MRISFNVFKFIWIPRAIMMVFILFFSLLSLDAFTGNSSFLDELTVYMVSMMPSFVMLLSLVILWDRPVASGCIFILLGIVFTVSFNNYEGLASYIAVSFIPIITGVLYFVPSIIRRRRAPNY